MISILIYYSQTVLTAALTPSLTSLFFSFLLTAVYSNFSYNILCSYPSRRPDHLAFLRDQLSPHILPPCLYQTPCHKNKDPNL